MAKTEKTGSINRVASTSLGLGFCVFAIISLMSFDLGDWPNPDIAPAAVKANLCGPAGAFLAYYGNYYLGAASVPAVMAIAGWLILNCLGRRPDQFVLRAIGVVLICAVIAGASYLANRGDSESTSLGNGGVLGIAVGHFLLTKTALTGAILIMAAAMVVGLLLAVDNLLLMLPAFLFRANRQLSRTRPVFSGLTGRFGRLGRGTACGDRTIIPTRQSDAAIQRVTSLDEHEEDQEQEFAPDEDELFDSADDRGVKEENDGDDETDAEDQRERKSSIKAVSSALSQLMGRSAKTAALAGATNEEYLDYQYPPLEYLEEPTRGYSALQEKVVLEKGRVLEQTLGEFNIDATVVEAETGPVITMFELQLAAGIKVAQISNLANDLARALGAPAVRVVAPIPGKHTIGIEVPNSQKEKVRLKELLLSVSQKTAKMQIPLFLGKDASGEPLVVDLTSMPHCLIAGTTGSGKSVCINSIIMSILMTQRPDLVKLILVDPKMVEMNAFRDIAHLMCPIVTEMKRAEQILEWLTIKMDERYAMLAEARVRNIAGYNALSEEQIYERFAPGSDQEKAKIPLRLPYIVIVIDELADLMMTSAKEVEGFIIRLAQKSRAVGIHIVLATQRPQATVVTGLIKSNLPTRISFRVSARMDSRIVLDQNGAEALLGQGDMLFLKPGTSDLIRAQGTFVADEEISQVIKHLKSTAQPNYHNELVQLNQVDASNMEKDELFDDAVRIVLQTRRGSVSLLQRRLTIGYSRASRLIDQMALAGIVGEYKGSQAREVLIREEDYEMIRRQMDQDAEDGYNDMEETDPEDNAVAEQDAEDIDEDEELEDGEEDEEEGDEEDEEEESGEDEELEAELLE